MRDSVKKVILKFGALSMVVGGYGEGSCTSRPCSFAR